jgi:hypothetical protein
MHSARVAHSTAFVKANLRFTKHLQTSNIRSQRGQHQTCKHNNCGELVGSLIFLKSEVVLVLLSFLARAY